jgi:hypothetical protein
MDESHRLRRPAGSRGVRHLATLVATLLATSTLALVAAPAHALVADVPSDFNGDGYADLAVSTIYEPAPDGTPWVGGVNVLYGSAAGLSAAGDQLFTEDSPGIAGSARKDDYFGQYLMPGDFDGDGYDDLAVGAPGESVSGHDNAGAVIVIYGSSEGLAGASAHGSVELTLDTPGVPGGPRKGDRMGYQLATGDVNHDGYDELAVGIASRDVGDRARAGEVLVLQGSSNGLSGTGSQVWDQSMPGVPGAAATGAEFGSAIRMGDLDGNGYDDLAVGAPFARVDAQKQAGTVTVLYSTAAGLGTDFAQGWVADSDGLPASGHVLGRFGYYLAIANFGNGAQADLAIGAVTDTVSGLLGAGSVTALYGSATGLTAGGAQRWTEDTDGVPGDAAYYDEFGDALAVGDMGNGPESDLAIGVAYDNVGSVKHAGSFRVLYGSTGGLTAAGAQRWTQDSPGVPDHAESGDLFGYELFSSDFDGDGVGDVASSAAYERLVEKRSGVVNVIYGTPGGLSGASAQVWSQDSPGVLGKAGAYEYFGFSVG